MATDPNTYGCTLHTCFFTFFSPLCFPLEKGGGEKTNVKREWQWVGLVKRDGEQWSKKKENEKERGEMDRQIHQRKGERERDGLKNKRRGGKDEY